MKKYNIQYNVGKAKYLVNYHDGIKKYSDGSDFYDIKIINSKKELLFFTNSLEYKGYKFIK